MLLSSEAVNKKLVEYSYDDAPTLERFASSDARVRGVMGPFGSGKSSACVMEIIQRALQQAPGPDGIRRTRWAVVRNTYPQLQDTTIKTFFQWFPPEYCGEYSPSRHDYKITELEGCEIEIMFRALDRPEHVKNLLSLEITGAWINEAREVPEEIIDGIDGRIGRYPSMNDGGCTWCGVFMDTNPPQKNSWWFRKFEDGPDKAEGWEIFKQPSGLSADAENTSHMAEGYYENLAKGKRKEWVNVYVHGNYGFLAEGGVPVTPEYNPAVHFVNHSIPVIPGAMGFMSFDGGHRPTCLLGQVTPSGRLHFIHALQLRGKGMRQLITAMVKPVLAMNYEGVDEWFVTGDPSLSTGDQGDVDSVPARIIEKELSVSFSPGPVGWDERRESAKDALNDGIDGKSYVLIGKDAAILHEALLGGWHYAKTNSGLVMRDKPVKDEFSDPGDCFGYLLAKLSGKTATRKKPAVKQASMRSYA